MSWSICLQPAVASESTPTFQPFTAAPTSKFSAASSQSVPTFKPSATTTSATATEARLLLTSVPS